MAVPVYKLTVTCWQNWLPHEVWQEWWIPSGSSSAPCVSVGAMTASGISKEASLPIRPLHEEYSQHGSIHRMFRIAPWTLPRQTNASALSLTRKHVQQRLRKERLRKAGHLVPYHGRCRYRHLPLIPWNTCGMTQATILSVPTLTYLPIASSTLSVR